MNPPTNRRAHPGNQEANTDPDHGSRWRCPLGLQHHWQEEDRERVRLNLPTTDEERVDGERFLRGSLRPMPPKVDR
jgi:hypothetical protein